MSSMRQSAAGRVTRFLLLTALSVPVNRPKPCRMPARDANSDIVPVKEKAEAYLRESGLDYTIIVRAGSATWRQPAPRS
jgi:uncharacterized protein YbjT (DUF2867 family)